MNQVLCSEDYSPFVYKGIIKTAYIRKASNNKASINKYPYWFLPLHWEEFSMMLDH